MTPIEMAEDPPGEGRGRENCRLINSFPHRQMIYSRVYEAGHSCRVNVLQADYLIVRLAGVCCASGGIPPVRMTGPNMLHHVNRKCNRDHFNRTSQLLAFLAIIFYNKANLSITGGCFTLFSSLPLKKLSVCHLHNKTFLHMHSRDPS